MRKMLWVYCILTRCQPYVKGIFLYTFTTYKKKVLFTEDRSTRLLLLFIPIPLLILPVIDSMEKNNK